MDIPIYDFSLFIFELPFCVVTKCPKVKDSWFINEIKWGCVLFQVSYLCNSCQMFTQPLDWWMKCQQYRTAVGFDKSFLLLWTIHPHSYCSHSWWWIERAAAAAGLPLLTAAQHCFKLNKRHIGNFPMHSYRVDMLEIVLFLAVFECVIPTAYILYYSLCTKKNMGMGVGM